MCVIEKVKVKPKPGLLENRTHSLRWLANINSRAFKPQRKRILNLWTSLEGDSLQCMIEKAFNFEFFFPHGIYLRLRSLFSPHDICLNRMEIKKKPVLGIIDKNYMKRANLANLIVPFQPEIFSSMAFCIFFFPFNIMPTLIFLPPIKIGKSLSRDVQRWSILFHWVYVTAN